MDHSPVVKSDTAEQNGIWSGFPMCIIEFLELKQLVVEKDLHSELLDHMLYKLDMQDPEEGDH